MDSMQGERDGQARPLRRSTAVLMSIAALAITGASIGIVVWGDTGRNDLGIFAADRVPTPTRAPLEGPTKITNYYSLTRVVDNMYRAGDGSGETFDPDQLIIDLKRQGCEVMLQPFPASGQVRRTYLEINNCDPFR